MTAVSTKLLFSQVCTTFLFFELLVMARFLCFPNWLLHCDAFFNQVENPHGGHTF